MPTKLMTLKELADYLRVEEEAIISLVEKRVIVAYRIGGELLRFRREQIDAIRTEIENRLRERGDIEETKDKRESPRVKLTVVSSEGQKVTFWDRLLDLFYFYDFYLISGLLIVFLLFVILIG